MSCRFGVRITLIAMMLAAVASAAPVSTPWVAFGPDGGDARRIAPDPSDHSHLFLGTANGWVYQSHNSGASWARLAQVGKRDDLVLDSIIVDPANPKHVVVGGWVIGDHADGGIYFTWDGGETWTVQAEMRGQSVLSLTSSSADAKMMVAGTLKGVFRSTDGGMRWKPISPDDSKEIREVQSVAIDPKDTNIIYAGTWHLPWKTTDGGVHWENIGKPQGVIDDSDVFSIVIDPLEPKKVFISACSGIYKSENYGGHFDKIQGIPSSARRTRRLLQDPTHFDTVFAGTTEGLYRSDDAGKSFQLITAPGIIVNDVAVDLGDPRHVLIATDRGGVLASDDGGDTFHPSNSGFSARQVTTLKRDVRHADTIFVGVVNDKDWGGVFQSDDGGQRWTQRSKGLEGRDVFSLGQAPDGTMIAGTAHGLFRLDASAQSWTRVQAAPGIAAAPAESVQTILTRAPLPVAGAPVSAKSQRKLTPAQLRAKQVAARPAAMKKPQASAKAVASTKKPAPASPTPAFVFDGSVYGIVTSRNTVLAATSVGLLKSEDDGINWSAGGPKDSAEWRFIAAQSKYVVAASLHAVHESTDGGILWQEMKLPEMLTQISAVAVEPNGEVWVGGREGIFVSTNGGNTWTIPKNLFLNAISNITYDEPSNRITITTNGNASLIFTVLLPGKQVNFTDTGWNLRFARQVGDQIIGATLFDGIVLQPRVPAQPVASQPVAPFPARTAMLPEAPSAAQAKQD